MSMPGWYPDPAGGQRYRYWDGNAWSDHTTQDPREPPPLPATRPSKNRSGGGFNWVWLGVMITILV